MIFASNNTDKISQVKKFLPKFNIVGLKEYGVDVDVVEDANTFEGNAIKKAKEIYNLTGEEVIADDSGLCIDLFDGWPGVLTHRFLGENSTEKQRNQYILKKMKDVPISKRGCKVECAIAYCDKRGKITLFMGEFKSKISFKQQGKNFFGFDSIVYADKTYTKTIADFTDEEKLKINARSKALKKLNKFLLQQRSI